MIFGVQQAFLVNLKRRPDRLQAADKALKKIGINPVIVFNAVDAKTLGIRHEGTLRPGMVGCFLSHYMLLQIAIMNNLESILIFEDDVNPIINADLLLKNAEKCVPDDWEFLWLGYSYSGDQWERNRKNAIAVNDYWQIPEPTWGTQAFAIRGKETIKKIYDAISTIKTQIDVQLTTDVLKKLGIKTYAITPCAFNQTASKSDVQI